MDGRDDRDDHDDRGGRTETEPARREGDGVDRERTAGDESRGTDRPTVDPADSPSSRADERRSSLEPEPGPTPDSEAGRGGEPPGPRTIRNWTGLTLALAVLSFLTAAAIYATYETGTAAGGAVALGLGFGGLALAGRTVSPAVFVVLDDAWTEHRPYVWFSTALFALGVVLGAALYAAGVNLTELFLEMIVEEFGEDELGLGDEGDLTGEANVELTASFFIANNTPPFLAAIFGALTLGFATVAIMVFNGVLVGNIAAFTGSEVGFGVIVALLVPHGVFELPALFVAAGVGFRFLHRVGQRIAGTRDALFTKAYLLRTTALVVFAWLVLVLAAFVEAYVTLLVADLLFPSATG